jgi:hypothetical protein
LTTENSPRSTHDRAHFEFPASKPRALIIEA